MSGGPRPGRRRRLLVRAYGWVVVRARWPVTIEAGGDPDDELLLAYPVVNTPVLFPGAGERYTTLLPRSSRAINTAGITLAVSFALVALIPVAPFEELAFAVAAGLLIDAFFVRSLLVPALISLVGPTSGWPGNRLSRHRLATAPGGPGRSSSTGGATSGVAGQGAP